MYFMANFPSLGLATTMTMMTPWLTKFHVGSLSTIPDIYRFAF